jgi:hypothetical protein
MSEDQLITEEDIKAKILSHWLRDHGFGANDITLEKTFELKFGRGVFVVGKKAADIHRARCDYLVKAIDGRNLMILEVKSPKGVLSDSDKEQAISYARTIRSGGIAPYTIITNGFKTLIYDSISGQLLNGEKIPQDHPHAMNGFRYSGDDISLRAEAINLLISLSPENLLAFCTGSVNHHLKLLRSIDVESGKKYIPALYIERQAPAQQLEEFVLQRTRSVLLVTGPPQVGKTNLLCKFVENCLDNNHPVLFYPSISFRKGLLDELADDFEWGFLADASIATTAQRLKILLSRMKKDLIIVVDGWNEAEIDIARALNDELKRIASENIRFVLSLTNIAGRRLLIDRANNSTFVADAIGLSRDSVPLLDLDLQKLVPGITSGALSLVVVDCFSHEEAERAYSVYSQVYSVTVPTEHERTRDPFILGVAMPLFRDRTLPQRLDEPQLIEKHLRRKALQAGGIDPASVQTMLSKLGEEIFEQDAPVSEDAYLHRCRLPASSVISAGLFESALLVRRGNSGCRTLDFYYGRERDFVIAMWSRNWSKLLADAALELELRLALKTSAGRDAFVWFLSQGEHLLQLSCICSRFKDLDDEGKCLLLKVIADRFEQCGKNAWAGDCLKLGLTNDNPKVRIEAVRMMAVTTDAHEELAAYITCDPELLEKLLLIDVEFSLSRGSAGQVVLDALRSVHWDNAPEDDDSDISDALSELLRSIMPHTVRAASKALGYIGARLFLRHFAKLLAQGIVQRNPEAFFAGVEQAEQTLSSEFYGDMCPGTLSFNKTDMEWRKYEYREMADYFRPIIRYYGSKRCESLRDLLADLRPPSMPDEFENIAPIYVPGQPNLI